MQVKICGITHPEDAYHAAKAGADFIGVIFSPLSKRVVSLEQARDIQSAINNTKAQLVGVFVEESVQQIVEICTTLNISVIQLHGKQSLNAIEYLMQVYFIFYVLTQYDQFFYSHFSERIMPLFDNVKSDNHEPFDWLSFSPPQQPWVLAGGLTVTNVAKAIQLLNPSMVDVARGVERADSIRKDHHKVQQFIAIAKTEKKSCLQS